MTENMKIAMMAINKWVFFSLNYSMVVHQYTTSFGTEHSVIVPQFLVEAKWNCSFKHMLDKWNEVIRYKDSRTYLLRFYCELSTANRIALLEWVVKNYHNESCLIENSES